MQLKAVLVFESSFSEKEEPEVMQKLSEIASKGSVTIEELNDLIPGIEHRKINFIKWGGDQEDIGTAGGVVIRDRKIRAEFLS